MEKNYNYNFENRKQSQKSNVSVSGLDIASCPSSALKNSPVVNGRAWHTTDTNEFYFDWNGKRAKLNLTGDNASLESEINKLKAQIKALDVDTVQNKINQLETKVQNAASQANSAKNAAQTAKQEALAAAQQAQEAADSVASKASTDYVDEKVSHAFDNLTDAQKEELRGPAGAAGKDGKDGVDGQDGAPGKDGADGLPGADGKDGQDGKDGVDGAPGKDGVDGKDGENGLSAYEVAVAAGFNGTVEAWLESLKGADGKDGVDGAPGKDGVDGKDGKDGEGITAEDRAKLDAIPDDLVQGAFPDGSDPEGSDFTPGLATVQDVIEYVNALIEKKKDELGPADDKDYFYVNGVEAAVLPNLVVPDSPTSIYQMNQVEITDSILENGYEVYISPEANGYYAPDSPVDTIYSEVFSVYVPTGYTLKVYCYDEDTDDKWSAVEEPMVVHPKHATIQYGSKTYNCYARRSLSSADDEYAGIGEYSPYSGAYSVPTRYKIVLSK